MLTRDPELFPQDDTGNRLWQLLNQGIDLNLAYEVELSVIFQTEQQALAFGQLLLANNQKISFSPFAEHPSHQWEITVYPTMPLNYSNIIGYQELLASHMAEFSGLFDGWFCAVTAL